MGFLLALLAVGGLLALAGSSKASSSGTTSPPAGSLPPNNGQTVNGVKYLPVKNTAKAKSGAVYETWFWPPGPGGTYSVVRLGGTIAWLAFTYNPDTNKSTPAKTNIMELPVSDGEKSALLKSFQTDWSLPT